MPLILLGVGSWAVLAVVAALLVICGNHKPTPSVPPRVSQAPTGVPLDPEPMGDVDAFIADVLGDPSC